MKKSDTNWRQAADIKELHIHNILPITIESIDIVLIKLSDDIYAIHDSCTHEYFPLSNGAVDNDTIECPLHSAVFHIPTGELMSGPMCDNLRIFPVKIKENTIYVDING